MPVTREFVESFYKAALAHESAQIARFLDDDVEWMLTGPVDVLSYCGRSKGKAAAIDMINRRHNVIKIKRFEFDEVLIAGDHVATLSWLVGTETKTGREVKFRCSHFMRFRDGKLLSLRAVRDTFRFVEQVLGHKLDLSAPVQEQAA
jgi:ketosteroid isomerase-like protein